MAKKRAAQQQLAAPKKGGKVGAVAGSWVFVPAGAPTAFAPKNAWKGAAVSKFAGKASGKVISKFSGKGGGKNGAAAAQLDNKKWLDKVQKVDPSCKVWIGGLNQSTTWKKLEALFKDVVKPATTVIMKKGTAVMSFKTAEDADTAISTFNGSELDGKSIQVDVWTQKEKTEKTEKKKKQPVAKDAAVKKVNVGAFAKKALQPSAKAAAKGKKKDAPKPDKFKEKMQAKLKEVDNSCKAWVGDLPKDVTWQQVKDHFKEMGAETEMCVLGKPGIACVTFKSSEEASSAIVVANGTEFNGNAIQVDTWTMPEKKDKKKKKEAA
eukprot:TRINITY_DN46156_c0_g1_i1.p1 TRINITY_DN46156_c0_g1~~TRINITY_DN46156_c0_g1_i1.p1  ORF type:complete len:322 (-),score=104.43 TRINITY_DN46156_c0_g1_i1:164-1129(-)